MVAPNVKSISPLMTAIDAGAAPLNGTCVQRIPRHRLEQLAGEMRAAARAG